ncbi:MAG TPA: DinB family protein [Tepidisphaeraceae bacterium]|nr:DinB family protein [Tepidisphaeraceae bacterium]
MTQIELAADVLSRNVEILKMTLADFSDADMLVRPCQGANHAAWQLGHVIAAETRLVGMFGATGIPELPAGFADKFTKETSKKDDAGFFPGKAALCDQFVKTRAGTVAWVKTLKPADLDKPMPETMAARIPTLGHVVALLPTHMAMHIGQFQVIRRKLGKPVLF